MNEKQSGKGKSVVLAGGTSGIGLATVKQLLADGADVIAVGRDADRCAAAVNELRRLHPDGTVDYITADLSTTGEVRRAAREIARLLEERGRGSLDALINNAAAVSTWRMVTPEGFEQQFALNHLAAFLLSRELLPLLEKGRGRVITVGSASHRGARMNWGDPMFTHGYNTLRAYRQSKLANVLFSAEFNRRYPDSPVRAYVFDPGLVRTDIGLKQSTGIARLVWKIRSRSRGAVPPEVPAAYLAALVFAKQVSGHLYWHKGSPAAAHRRGLDPVAGARLWALSLQLCQEDPGQTS
jgi:NAD(P)-dependent dehydrogenase (short-subunit alcohol dehydrogenase family)